MVSARRTLAIVALTTTLMSCGSSEVPVTSDVTPRNTIRLYATTSVYPLAVDLMTVFGSQEHWPSAEVHSSNYGRALEYLMTQPDGVILTTSLRSMSGLWAAPVGIDGIAIIVNQDVDVQNLAIDQIRAIYQGRLANWRQVEGKSQRIVVVSREAGSATRYEFDRMVMGNRPTTAGAMVVTSSQQMINRVASTSGAIGYVSWGLTGEDVKIVALDGIMPSLAAIEGQFYPLRTTIYLVGVDNPTPEAQQLLNWIQSEVGQAVVSEHYVPVSAPLSRPD